jgi:hypothetical protein
MKKTEVRGIIFETLRPILVPSGFRLKKAKEEFVRPIPSGTQRVGVPLWDYNPKFDFSLNLAMRIEAAEEITNRFSGSPPKYHSITLTIITQLEHLRVQPLRWRAETEGELRSQLLEVSRIVQERVIPFFDRYQELPIIAAAANEAPPPVVHPENSAITIGMCIAGDRSQFASGNQPYRSMSAITLAHLARLENFDALVTRHQKELSPMRQTERDKFDNLVQFLRESGRAV